MYQRQQATQQVLEPDKAFEDKDKQTLKTGQIKLNREIRCTNVKFPRF
jgi:hypothetical protein